jgi:hypothetical protein
MSPVVPNSERIAELSDELDRVQDRYNRHRAQQDRAIRYYDDCPDGDPRKAKAVTNMNRISDLIRADEAKMSTLVDELDELGAYN